MQSTCPPVAHIQKQNAIKTNTNYTLSETTMKTCVESNASARRNGGQKRHASSINLYRILAICSKINVRYT
eukprot:3932080-Alexandrium_andersonii.AAC.1